MTLGIYIFLHAKVCLKINTVELGGLGQPDPICATFVLVNHFANFLNLLLLLCFKLEAKSIADAPADDNGHYVVLVAESSSVKTSSARTMKSISFQNVVYSN